MSAWCRVPSETTMVYYAVNSDGFKDALRSKYKNGPDLPVPSVQIESASSQTPVRLEVSLAPAFRARSAAPSEADG